MALVASAFVVAELRFTTVDVVVVSNETASAVSYTLFLDGGQIGSGVIEPSQKVLYRVPLAWWSAACEPHSLAAVGSAGEPFSGSGSQDLTICAGTSYATVLFV